MGDDFAFLTSWAAGLQGKEIILAAPSPPHR